MSEDRTIATGVDRSAASAGAVSDQLKPGTPVGSYVVVQVIAEGGCGAVYRARHAILGRPVAIKVLRRDYAGAHPMARRFLMEAMAVNMIRHPSIVDIFDVGDLPDGRPFYVMEYLEGQDLDTHIKQQGRMTPTEALSVFSPVCDALEAAHHAGFVHRDIKASNIHVGRDGAGRTVVKLLDFGVAKALHPEQIGAGLTQAGSRIGTSSTMAPEQIVGTDITPQTDVYALGVLLFKVLVGRNPFLAQDPRDLDQMHLKAQPPRASELAAIPSALDDVITRAMAKSPKQRHASAATFLQDMRAAVVDADSVPKDEQIAVGLYVEARVATDASDADDCLDRAMTAMDPVEAQLADAGFHIAMRAGTSLLGALPLASPRGVKEARHAVATGERIAAAMREALGDTAVEVITAVHVAPILTGPGGEIDESSSGALTSISDWVPSSAAKGVHASDDVKTRLAAAG